MEHCRHFSTNVVHRDRARLPIHMQYIFTSWKQFIIGCCIFFSLFAALSLWYVRQHTVRDSRQFEMHATILAHDLWALNHFGVKSYLQLAVRANHYKNLIVTLEDGTPFYQISSPPLSGPDKLLYTLHLLPINTFSIDILSHGKQIGTLMGEHYSHIFYPLINIFLVLLLLVLITIVGFNLFHNHKLLAQLVDERTRKYRESERRFHDLVNLLPEMVAETDARGNLTYANKIFLKQFKISNNSLKGLNFLEYIVPEQREHGKKVFAALLQGKEQHLEEFMSQDQDGTIFPVLVRSAPIVQDTKISGVRSVIIDITERCSLEKQLRKAQRMEIIGMMAGGVAHDLNNILSGVINYPELILMKLPRDSELRRHVKAIKKSGLRATEVVADLLTVSRGLTTEKTVANPNTLISEYLESPEFLQIQSLFPQLNWQTDLDPATPNISCSPIHVQKCLMNLINNAAEAIPDTGQITISTETRQIACTENRHSFLARGSYAVIGVTDTAPGIAAQDLAHIFEPFYTKKTLGRSGTGLGLTVVWNTMQDHKGTVRVNSTANGTTFLLYFPASNREVIPDVPPAGLEGLMGNGEKILIIDDNPQQRDIAQQLLTSLNYTVSWVSSGEEAVVYLRTRFVHLLLLDMLMPPGINGLQTYQQILVIHPTQKAVIASGFSADSDVKKTLQLGAAAFIQKPYTMEQVGQIVHDTLQ